MKRIAFILAVLSAFAMTSCGVGTYSVASGMADKGAICFVDESAYDITVEIDGKTYQTTTVKQKDWKKRRNIKQTAKQSITLAPGTHTVKVKNEQGEIFSQSVFISAAETKMIEL